MNDITALMATMKAAAEKATPGRIGDRIDGSGSIKYQCFGNDGSLVLQTDHKNWEYGFIGPNSEADELFFRMCSPENIKSLTEALEKAQTEREEFRSRLKLERSILEDADKRIAELEGTEQKLCAANVTLDARAELAERRLAELESRNVTAKLYDDFQLCHYGTTEDYAKGYIDCQNNFTKWLAAAGIQVIEGGAPQGA